MRNIRFGQCRIIHSQPLESGRGVDIVLFGTRLIASGGFTTGPMEGGGGGGGGASGPSCGSLVPHPGAVHFYI